MAGADEKLQKLIDIEEVKTVKSLYCDLIDRLVRDRDPDDAVRLSALFTQDVVFDFGTLGFGRFEGREAVVRFFQHTLPGFAAWTWHSVHSPVIQIKGDEAEGQWTLYARSVPVGGEPAPSSPTIGRYADRFRRENGTWKQTSMRFLNETR